MRNNIKIYRSKINITQSQLAEKVGISRQSINAIETNKINPSVKVSLKIAEVLNTTVDALFSLGEDDETGKAQVIGIGGVSQSGKSSLARLLKDNLSNKSCKILSQDNYVVDKDRLPKVHGMNDWETPEAYDYDRLVRDLKEAKLKVDIVIIEGILIFNHPELLKNIDLKIFLEIPYELFIDRRSRDTRWGQEPEWYFDHVWNQHLRSGNIKGKINDLICIKGDKPFDLTPLLDKIS